MNVDLGKLDLNLLRILQVLVKTKNAQQTAQQLNLSPTSVSRALKKLREHFGENLFIRQPHGIQPSELAYELAVASEAMLIPLEQVILQRTRFNHELYKGKITIAVNTYLLELFGDQLTQALLGSFPEARFQLECWDNNSNSKIFNGDIDYGLQFSGYPFPTEFYTPVIQRVENRIVFSKDHRLQNIAGTLEWTELAQFPIIQLLVKGINETSDLTSIEYLKRGFSPHIRLKTDNLKTACHYVQNSDAIMVGSRLLENAYPGLTTVALPNVREELKYTEISSVCLRASRDMPLIKQIEKVVSNLLKQSPLL